MYRTTEYGVGHVLVSQSNTGLFSKFLLCHLDKNDFSFVRSISWLSLSTLLVLINLNSTMHFQVASQETYEPWVLSSKARQGIGRLVSSLIGMWLLIWIIQARKCCIRYLQVLDQGCTQVVWRGRHHSLLMISGTALLLEPARYSNPAPYCKMPLPIHGDNS